MTDRFINDLSTDFRIFTDKAIIPLNALKPTREVKEEVAKIFQRNFRENNPGRKMSDEEAKGIVKDIIKNVELDPLTKSPVFSYQSMSMLDDFSVQSKNISKNVEYYFKRKHCYLVEVCCSYLRKYILRCNLWYVVIVFKKKRQNVGLD